ncbi:MAG: cytochrome-c peroxidase [Deltaproteobacteria bacterium]|nr:cytochrome-c peroxidase [Deltaproteobacteria bacterium]
MMKNILLAVAVTAFAFFGAEDVLAKDAVKGHFKPLTDGIAENAADKSNGAREELGKMLFMDPRLSKSGFLSCNSCHNISTGGVDNLSTSIGHGWQIGPRNAPTVFNAALNGTQFWDGRAKDVEEQAGGPILNPGEMGSNEALVLERLGSIDQYKKLFRKAFPDDAEPLNYKNVARAIAAFERTLITPSRFDAYLKGKDGALSKAEKNGLKLFVDKGCVACHNGVNVGGAKFTSFDYGSDEGRFSVTKKEADKKSFRVASLRNAELTYPYFHDGSVWTLEEAVKIMGKKQLNKDLTDEETADIVAFIKALTGEHPVVRMPALPPSVASTPRPEVR